MKEVEEDEKEAFLSQGLTWFFSAIATLNIVGLSLVPNTVLADSTTDNITLKVEELKQSDERWIEVDLSEQHLYAWDGKNQAFTAVISTGKVETPTYPGVYTIQRKYPLDRMRGSDYDVPNVPNVLYFNRGYALHGANWHNNFGTPMSHGCVNLPVGNAEWLFDWAKIGTPVIIHQ